MAQTTATYRKGQLIRTFFSVLKQYRDGLAALVDEALRVLLARERAAEVDASYVAYDAHPLDEPDAWGDLASFRAAAAAG